MAAGYSSFVPPFMVAGPNRLFLKKFRNQVKFEICFKFRLKAGYSTFAPPFMVAGPNGLFLKKISKPSQI
jgi:hypothetical protein